MSFTLTRLPRRDGIHPEKLQFDKSLHKKILCHFKMSDDWQPIYSLKQQFLSAIFLLSEALQSWSAKTQAKTVTNLLTIGSFLRAEKQHSSSLKNCYKLWRGFKKLIFQIHITQAWWGANKTTCLEHGLWYLQLKQTSEVPNLLRDCTS